MSHLFWLKHEHLKRIQHLFPKPRGVARVDDRGYDADWFRAELIERNIEPCIPSRRNRKVIIPHDTKIYRSCHKIENMFGRLKDWRRAATRYDRCLTIFMSAIALAATVLFWLRVQTLVIETPMPFRVDTVAFPHRARFSGNS